MSSSEKNGKNLEYLSMEESQEVMVKGTGYEKKGGRRGARRTLGCAPPWFKKRSTLEKGLLFLLLVLFVICVILLVCLVLAKVYSRKAEDQQHTVAPLTSINGVCVTPECVVAAGATLSKMDTTVEPCEDFYQYACGGWIEKHLIPDGEPKYTVFDELNNYLAIISKALLEARNANDSEAVTKAKNLYRSCMDEELIEQQGAQPLIDLVNDLGGWPAISGDTWDEDGWDLVEVLAKSRLEMDYNFLFGHEIGPDLSNKEENVIILDQPVLVHKQKTFYLKDRSDKAYMVDVATALRTDHNRTEAERQMKEALDFECALANFSMGITEKRDVTIINNRYTIADMEAEMPKLQWAKYFNLIHKRTLPRDQKIIIFNPGYFRKMTEHVHRTPKRTLANYLMWRILAYMIDYMSTDFRLLRQPFLAATKGETKEQVRWKVCFDTTNHILDMAMGSLFVRKHFDEESKARAIEMVSDIRNTLIETLKNVPWMDAETKERALKKASKIQEQIGYDDMLKDDAALNKEYEMLDITPDGYFNNIRAVWKDDARKGLMSKLGQPEQIHVWKRTPIEVNAFYKNSVNRISFPAGIFQPPFYSKYFPDAMNYGGIGMVIGHELMHGYDEQGSMFDDEGNFTNWFSNSSRQAYRKRLQCFVDQYSGYYLPEIDVYVNGETTQDEILADNGGIKEAYLAFKLWEKRHGRPGDVLPGLNLSHDQLFFLNYAQLWCSLHTPENLEIIVQSDYHPPDRFRVIGTLSNSEYFSDAFQCTKSDRMVNEKPCKLW